MKENRKSHNLLFSPRKNLWVCDSANVMTEVILCVIRKKKEKGAQIIPIPEESDVHEPIESYSGVISHEQKEYYLSYGHITANYHNCQHTKTKPIFLKLA